MSQVILNIFGFSKWLLLLVAGMILMVVVTIANYQGCSQALDLSGWESMPLKADHLFGWLIGPFLGNAMLSNVFALVLAGTLMLSIFLFFHLGFQLNRLFHDRAYYKRTGDIASMEEVNRRISTNLIEMGAMMIPLALGVILDLKLFGYRSVAGIFFQGHSVTPDGLRDFDAWSSSNSNSTIFSLQRFGALGYLAVTAMAALFYEISQSKLGEAWASLSDSIHRYFHEPDPNPPTTQEPILAEALPLDSPTEEEAVLGTSPIPTPEPALTVAGPPSPTLVVTQAEPIKEATQPTSGEIPFQSLELGGVLKDVIGGPVGDRVTLAYAKSNPAKYVVDEGNGDIWQRSTWEKAHPQSAVA